ncbi:unnamed protein product [Sphagnum tenellum]
METVHRHPSLIKSGHSRYHQSRKSIQMTKQSDIINDPNYVPLLDHGFVGYVDHMGSDAAITQAARVSYGSGTKSVREDRGLIRYLMRHQHWSPFEMCEVKFHIKLPIFVFRQMVRHRTANCNEYSGRYSIMTDEFYIPSDDFIAPQSLNNKQGRDGEIDDLSKKGVKWLIQTASETNSDIYKTLLGPIDGFGPDDDCPYAAYGTSMMPDDRLLSADYPGVARELARIVLPINNYTHLYWKMDLRNLFHLIKLRADAHAQKEIRVYAEAMHKLIQPLFPVACEAFHDYVNGAVTLSRMEDELVMELMHPRFGSSPAEHLKELIDTAGSTKAFASNRGLSERELSEFVTRFNLDVC